MKRLSILIIVSACILPMAYSQNFLGFNTDIGLAWQYDNLAITHSKAGVDFSIGGTYQLQKNMFLLHTGIGISPRWTRQLLDNETIKVNMLDTEEIPFTYIGYIEDRTDKLASLDLSIPLMMGVKYKKFYTLLGAKLYIPLVCNTHQTASLTTIGDYGDRYYDVLKDMPEHGFFTDKIVHSSGKLALQPDLKICIELGWNSRIPTYSLRPNAPCVQIGAFLEYGILNTLTASSFGQSTQVDCTPFMNIEMQHIYSTKERSDALVKNMRIGLRAAVLFPTSKNKGTRFNTCRCNFE